VARSTSFYYSFLALPAPKRRAILAVFDFCRAVDDGVDLAPDPKSAEQAVDKWKQEVDLVFSGGSPASPEGRGLQPLVAPFGLCRADFDALVEGVEMDASPRVYQTFAELEPYCHRVASAVGLMCVKIFGYRNPAVRDYARDLGVALQLTNILRDVAVDFRRGRIYLPAEDLARFGCSADDIQEEVGRAGAGIRNDRLRAVLEHHAARARVFFARAERALPKEETSNLVAAEIMRAIYWNLLQRIEAERCDVFSRVIRVPRPAQARIALTTWWRGQRVSRFP
jgi:15-cis-phytoene synthase